MPACSRSYEGERVSEVNKASVRSFSGSTDKNSNILRGLELRGPVQTKSLAGKIFSSMEACTYPETSVESHSHTAEKKIGVLLLNLGGPDTLQDVQPFLFNLFADPVCLSFHVLEHLYQDIMTIKFLLILFNIQVLFNRISYAFLGCFGFYSVPWHNSFLLSGLPKAKKAMLPLEVVRL